MIAFHGKQEIKAEYLVRIEAHEKADEIVHGLYWESGKGCAVGCTIHGSDHGKYETELGIPRILALLEDRIFEGMKNGDAKTFPRRFLSAVNPGADLSLVWPKFAVWLLVDKKHGVVRFTKEGSAQYIAIHRVADLYRDLKDWDKRDKAAFRTAAAATGAAYAADAADAAAYAAAYATGAAYAAAYATGAAYAADAADAAYAADAADAAYAADAADAAATGAAYAADGAATGAAYAADGAAAISKTFKLQADKLCELLAETK